MSLDDKIDEAHDILDRCIAEHRRTHDIVGTVGLFSGGNDSTVLAHLMKDRVTHFAHANTGIGIEETRVFVRKTSAALGKPLIEEHGDPYPDLVIGHGFPGPAHHYKMYQRLKERALRKVRRKLVSNGHRQRVIFIGGRRRDESARRKSRVIPESDRDGAIVFCSPIVHWTAADMKAYRERFPEVPRNEVADHIHMSGECLCGAFAAPGERGEIGFFYPDVEGEISELETAVRAAGNVAPRRCMWGWGALAPDAWRDIPQLFAPLCSSCDARRPDPTQREGEVW